MRILTLFPILLLALAVFLSHTGISSEEKKPSSHEPSHDEKEKHSSSNHDKKVVHEDVEERKAEAKTLRTHSGPSSGHWSYVGASGPEYWGNLSPDYEKCRIGTKQSPIDIIYSKKTKLPSILFDYRATHYNAVNNGHTVKIDYEKGSSIKIGVRTYGLLQFHFHAPSENKIEGETYPMEMHLVHKSQSGELAVIGVMFRLGSKNPGLEFLFNNFPSKKNERYKYDDTKFNVMSILPKDNRYYHFEGSLTTPPCSEGVKWYVLRGKIEASRKQLTRFMRIYSRNSRPIQELNGREVKHY